MHFSKNRQSNRQTPRLKMKALTEIDAGLFHSHGFSVDESFFDHLLDSHLPLFRLFQGNCQSDDDLPVCI